MRRNAEVGVSDRIVLRCPEYGELTMLLGRETTGTGRRAAVASGARAGRGCGSGVRLAHRLGEVFLDLPGLPGL